MVKVFLYTILICIVCIVDMISYTIPLIHDIFVYVSNLNGGHMIDLGKEENRKLELN